MARIIDSRTAIDRSVQLLDSFYSTNVKVNADQFDIVHGYFTKICSTKTIADNYTAMLFMISTQAGIDVLSLLKELKNTTNTLQMNKTICYYLNSLKSKATMYGVGTTLKSVLPVARNIVQ